MATTLTAQLQAIFGATINGGSGIGAESFTPAINTILNLAITNGTGASQGNQLYAQTLAIADGASTTLNVYDFGGNDPVGNAYAQVSAKLVIIQNLSATASDTLVVGGEGTASAWASPFGSATDTIKINGGGTLILNSTDAAGYTVGAATNNLLKLSNTGAAPFNVNVIIIGATA